MTNGLVKFGLFAFTTFATLANAIPSQALPNLPYRQEDTFVSTAKLNIRLGPCSSTIVGGANKGLTAYYTGQVSGTRTCFGRTSKWREVVFTGSNPEGSESIRGWVADYLLDNVPPVYNSQSSGVYVRVILNSGTLSLRKTSLTSPAFKQLPNGVQVYVQGYSSPVTIGGVKRYPTNVLYVDANGNRFSGWVDANYLVGFIGYD